MSSRRCSREVCRDRRTRLKQKLSQLAFGHVQALEKSPSSIGQQFVVAEIIDAQSKDDRESLRILAEALVIALNKQLSADDLVISKEWNAEFFKRQYSYFSIVLSKLSEYHRIEYQVGLYSGQLN
jgi:hypothetical protein